MGLFAQTPYQKLYSAALANSLEAIAAALTQVIGNGPIGSGLVVSAGSGSSVNITAGYALCGIVCQLASTTNLVIAGAGTYDIWACDTPFTTSGGVPVSGSYPNTSGIDALVPTVVNTGVTPAAPGCILATVVSSGTAITSVNNSPSGKNPIPGPSPAGTTLVRPQQANFTAQPDGTTAAFTLVNTPNPSRADVYKNGVLVDPTLYSLSGAVVTFATAPANTDEISAGYNY